jgi:Na+-transporting NADH:ubiquinone oxidoreductase subunit A
VREFRIRKGLDLPLPRPRTDSTAEYRAVSQVALVGQDYPLKPHFLVAEGDSVTRGQTLFTDKNEPRIRVNSPVTGKVAQINRGERRVFESLVLEVQNAESGSSEPYKGKLHHADRIHLREYLQQKGAWVHLRTRPFSLIAHPDAEPAAIFVNAMDTRPGAMPMRALIQGREAELKTGLEVLAALTNNTVFFCQSPAEDWSFVSEQNYDHGAKLVVARFAGPHPAGLSSTHIHFLRPASLKHTVWTISAQHVADIGALMTTGNLPNHTRLCLTDIARKGSQFIETLKGASTHELFSGFVQGDASPQRVIAGNILHGWAAEGAHAYVGMHHNQVTLLPRETRRHFLQWLRPGWRSHSITRTVLGRYQQTRIAWNTSLYGGERALVPIGSYERVMPLDILMTPLLRALLTGDIDQAAELGALELEPEDLSLATYVCPGKKDYGALLAEALQSLRKELL